MTTDPHDELARRRAEHEHDHDHTRDRKTPDRAGAEHAGTSAEQAAAIARAREAWLLRRVGRDAEGEDQPSGSE